MAAVPFTYNEVLNLSEHGIPEGSIKHGLTTMSDSWIVCVEPTQVAMIDLQNGAQTKREPMKVDAAIKNPASNILALRSGNALQMFNLDNEAMIKSHTITEPVVFWKWTGPNNLGLVTATSVYHWPLQGDGGPEKIFERHQTLGANVQIINYKVSPDGKWCLLVGISAGGLMVINGNMQLYSIDRKVSQPLEGLAAGFALLHLPGREDPAQVLVFHEKKAASPPNEPPKLFVMEVGRDPSKGPTYRVQPQAIPVPADAAGDFPVSLVVDQKDELAYLLTKQGNCYLFDIATAKCIYHTKVTAGTIFVTCAQESTGAVFGITVRSGQVLRIQLNPQAVVPFIVNTLRDNDLAIKIAGRLGLPGAENLYAAEFERLISSGNVVEAAKLVAASGNALRTPNTIQRFQQIPAQPGAPQPVFRYLSTLSDTGRLNEQESIELAKPFLLQGRPQLLETWLKDDKLQCSEELGDLIMPHDVGMALSVYKSADCHVKVIQCFLQRGEYDKIVPYANSVGFKMNYSQMFQQLMDSNPQGTLELANGLVSAEGGPLVDIQATARASVNVPMTPQQERFAAYLDEVEKGRQQSAKILESVNERQHKATLDVMQQLAKMEEGRRVAVEKATEILTHYDH